MAAHDVEVKRSAVKELRRLPKDVVRRSLDWFDRLAADPIPAQSRRLVGAERLYLIR